VGHEPWHRGGGGLSIPGLPNLGNIFGSIYEGTTEPPSDPVTDDVVSAEPEIDLSAFETVTDADIDAMTDGEIDALLEAINSGTFTDEAGEILSTGTITPGEVIGISGTTSFQNSGGVQYLPSVPQYYSSPYSAPYSGGPPRQWYD